MPSASAGIHFALITVAIDAMGVGIIFPVMPDLLLSMGQDSVTDAALWGGVLATVYALMQFLFSPIIETWRTGTGVGPCCWFRWLRWRSTTLS